MRNHRTLARLAGLLPTNQERAESRWERKVKRLERIAQQELLLVDAIRRREQGAEGMKPMPYAGLLSLMKAREGGGI